MVIIINFIVLFSIDSNSILYFDLFKENRFNFGTTQAIRTNWAYARLRGLFVILGLLSLIALLGFAIRNYIYHNPIYESTIVQSHHHSDIDNHSADGKLFLFFFHFILLKVWTIEAFHVTRFHFPINQTFFLFGLTTKLRQIIFFIMSTFFY